MKISIDDSIISKYGYTPAELFILLAIKTGEDLHGIMNRLLDEEKIVCGDDRFVITQSASNTVESILLDSDKVVIDRKAQDLETLAKELIEIFPRGVKEGTKSCWRSNVRDVSLRLKKFFKLYGNTYTSEQIIEATKQYVQSFNGVYTNMRILKYFILKDEKRFDGEGRMYVNEVSDLATTLENMGDMAYESDEELI